MGWSWLRPKVDWQACSSQQLLAMYLAKREPAILSVLFDRYGDALYRYLLRSADAAMAADISQQCWVRVMELGEQFAGNSQFKTWLFSIGRNLLLDEFRRQQRRDYLDDADSVLDQAPQVEQLIDLHQQERAMDAAIMQLPPLQRECILLQLEGFSVAEIAQISRVGEETTKSRLRYAREFLKVRLGAWA